MQPSSFKIPRNKKPINFRHFWQNLTLFERFLAPSLSKTTWSHQGPRNLNSIGFSRPVDPPGQAGGVLIAERKKSYSKCPQCKRLKKQFYVFVMNSEVNIFSRLGNFLSEFKGEKKTSPLLQRGSLPPSPKVSFWGYPLPPPLGRRLLWMVP